MRSKKWLISCGIVAIIVLVISIAGVLLAGLTIPIAPSMLAKNYELQVFIVKPVFNSTHEVKQPVSVYAEALGRLDIQKMDLWVDDHLWTAGSSEIKAGKNVTASWQWTPLEEGTHTLMVRATNAEGQAANSYPIQVRVVAEEPLPTPGALAENGMPAPVPPDLSKLTPPEGGGSDGEIPLPPPFPPEENPPEVDDNNVPGTSWIPIKIDLAFHNYTDMLFGEQELPKAPKIFANIKGCEVTLTIKDNAENESGFVIERKNPGSMEYQQIALLDARVGTGIFQYVDTGIGFGEYLYTVYAVNSVGKSMSNIVLANSADTHCLQPEQTSLGIVDAKIIPAKPIQKMYCYLSVDGASWTRIPPTPNTFIFGVNGEFDFSQYLGKLILNPPAGGITISLDCWGWDGSTLVHLGTVQKKIDAGTIQLVGDALKILGVAKKQYLMDGEGDFPPDPHIAAPTNFHFAQNESDCSKIPVDPQSPTDMAAWCKEAIKLGMFPAIWDWQPDAGSPCDAGDTVCKEFWEKNLVTDIDGYNVYYTFYSNIPTKIATYNYPSMKFAFIEPVPDQGHLKADYIVRAYKGNLESDDSNRINLETTPGTLHTIDLMQYWHIYSSSGIPLGQSAPSTDDDKVPVGYYWDGKSSNNGVVDDVLVQFDILSDQGLGKGTEGAFSKKIVRATLFWSYIDHYGDGAGFSLFDDGCRNTLWDKNGKIYGYYLNGIEGYDVTPQIRQMNEQGYRVAEFTLKSGRRTPLNFVAPNACIEYYGKFKMEIVVFN